MAVHRMGRGAVPAALLALATLGSCGDGGIANNAAVDQAAVPPQASAGNAGFSDAAVAPETVNAAAEAGAGRPLLNLSPDGLTLVLPNGSGRQLTFGMERAATVATVGTALGAPVREGENPECGAGPLQNSDFPGGLTLFFQGGKFVGWDLDGREKGGFTTAAGIGIGSTRKEIADVIDLHVEESSIGIEFSAGDLYGLLSSDEPDGRVTNLWAGTNCIFR